MSVDVGNRGAYCCHVLVLASANGAHIDKNCGIASSNVAQKASENIFKMCCVDGNRFLQHKKIVYKNKLFFKITAGLYDSMLTVVSRIHASNIEQ